ncbi:MAG: CHAT domain-containing protein, partial [Planctomycetota bacterium]
RELEESVLQDLLELLSEEHPDVISARANLGRTLYELGEVERARGFQETVLDALDHLPKEHPDVLQARGYLALTTHTLNDLDVTEQLLGDQLEGLGARFEAALTASSREARAISLEEATHIAGALFLSEDSAVDRNASLFSVLETRRHLATHSANVSHFGGIRAGKLRREANRLSRDLTDLVLAGPALNQEIEDWRAGIAQASMKLGRAQRELLELLVQTVDFVRRIDVDRVAEKLQEGTAAVGYHRYDRWHVDEETGGIQYDNPCILALVELPDGSVQRVELGTVEAISDKINAWRDAVGRPIDVDRGTPIGKAGESREEQTAKELRRVLLDPVFAASGGATTLFVCLDDVLHLVPLDALLLEDGDRVGDRFAIRQEISFARLLAPPPPSTAGPSMLAMGNVNFDAGIVEEPSPGFQRVAIAAIDTTAYRSGTWGIWKELRHTRYEVQDLQALFEDNFDSQLTPLTGKHASKAALRSAVVGKRHIHLATHGWFTPKMVPSLADVKAGDPFAQRLSDTVRGFAPLTLCGLCLASANSGKDASGRMPGLLTAQELAGFDLSACDLAVLSACETNVGVHRAGQGILSLQTALHAAGARTAITSLWSVQDRATGDLMRYFYENLWERDMGKAEALWEAKRKMRAEGLPVETWSGWVLTGDPD